MAYTNSPLVSHVNLSPNHSGQRTHVIDRISPHCVVGQCTVEGLGGVFEPVSRQASSNYGIGYDGKVGMYVEEKNRSWCTSSNANDQRAVTIEVASDTVHPYAMNDAAYNSLIELCVDICKRNGKTKLLWFGDKDKTLNYEPASNEMVITVHRWFANKSCPGDWLYSRLGDLADKVTAKLGDTTEKPKNEIIYRVQVGAFSKRENAEAMAAKLKAAGYDVIIKTEIKEIPKQEEPKEETFKVGDKVKLQDGAPVYGTTNKFASWVYSSTLYVREIGGSRAVISTVTTGAITGAVDKKYLTKI